MNHDENHQDGCRGHQPQSHWSGGGLWRRTGADWRWKHKRHVLPIYGGFLKWGDPKNHVF